jgi:hypothetical protein
VGRRAESFGFRFGLRYPRLTISVVCILLGGFVAACSNELSEGTYLGAYWLICAVAGMAAAAGFSAVVLTHRRRRGHAAGRLTVAWSVLTLVTMPSITAFPFPHNSLFPPPSPDALAVQKFFNVVHAVMLGYTTMSFTALIILLVCLAVRRGPRWRSQQAKTQPGRSVRAPASGATWPASRSAR